MAAPDPGSGNYRLAVISVSSPSSPGIVTGTRPAARPAAATVPRPRDRRDPWLRTEPSGPNALPLAGQPGHGSTPVLRREPVLLEDGRFEGGYTDLFEFICPRCGDNPDLDFSEIPPRLQWLRGPRPLEAALAAYHMRLGLPWPVRPGLKFQDPGQAKASKPVSLYDYCS